MSNGRLGLRLRGIEKIYPEPFNMSDIPRLLAGRHKRRAKHVLHDINLEVGEGERVGIIGQNGAGKSTLLKMIAGTAMPSAGEINIEGKVHAVLTLGIGLREEYSGRENLYLEAEALGRSRSQIAPIIEDMIEFADLGEFIDKPVKTYSSGMKSRLVFSSLVFVEPEILMLDETLATGDQWFQAKARQAIHRLCERGKIVIVVSHSMGSIIDICSRCIWIRDGMIAADGDPREVVRKYEEYQRTRIEAKISVPVLRPSIVTSSSGVSIESMLFRQNGIEQVSGTVTSGSALTIEADLRGMAACLAPQISMRLTRADGLLLVQSGFSLGSKGEKHSVSSVACTVEAFDLGPGRYECTLTVTEADETMAEMCLPILVQANKVPKGGTPLFLSEISMEPLP